MIKKDDSYYRGSSCKFKLTAHLCLVTKFRYKTLIGQLKDDLKQIIQDISSENDWNIQILETDVDHIHILFDYKPNENISNIVKKIKQYSSFRIWDMHPELRNTYFGKRKLFWSGGYFICSIGDASNETIKQYIEKQG